MEYDWPGLIPAEVREAMVSGRSPALVSETKPPYKGGDRIVIDWARVRDPSVSGARYPHRWITVTRVSRANSSFRTEYAQLEKGALYLRRGGGTTPDRLQSIDREVEYEPIDILPSQIASNTIAQVRRRMETRLSAHERRYKAGSPATRKRLAEAIASAKQKLTELEDRAA